LIVDESVEEQGRKCYLIARDLTKKGNCREAVDFAVEKMGGIDILFNNAACGYPSPFLL
jgi:NAD(P)-dependent dehydrogenase (short-subunit alcohol dehydrogenase family)